MQGKPTRRPRPAETRASDHRHRGAKAALQLLGQLLGADHGHGAELADGLAAAADVDGVALMAIGFDANCFTEAQGLREHLTLAMSIYTYASAI